MTRLNDKWIRAGGVALLLLNLFVADYGSGHRTLPQQLWYMALYLLFAVLILEAGRAIILSLHKRYPAFTQGKKRFWTTVLFVSLSNALLIPLTFNLFHWLRGMRAGNSPFFFVLSASAGLLLALLQTGIYEGFYNFYRLRKLEQEREELVRANLQSQFNSLKQQVNPHFLFNSINTVSSLISIDPARARKFLAEMSKVYRYLLKANEDDLTTLERELAFTASYFHLLKTRFGDGLQLRVEVAEEYRNRMLPVLSLQLLLENAVKHNTIEAGQPLTITICVTPAEQLCVKNNLQKKQHSVESNKVGLTTILTRYRLLEQSLPVITETNEEFIVLIPLIQRKLYERIDR